MPEGVALLDGAVVGEPTFNDRDNEPAADPVLAPNGWTWDRSERRWRAKQRRGRPGKASTPSPAADIPQEPADKDPEPGWMRDAKKPAGKPKFADVPRQVKDDIAGLAGLVGVPILSLLQSVDPYCGGALAQAYEGVVDACLPLLCRSEKVVAYFSGDKSSWLLVGNLAMALAPVGRAVVEHHVTRTVQLVRDPESGAVQVVRGVRGQGGAGDFLVPPMPDASAYAA